jgi:hypothetical protein
MGSKKATTGPKGVGEGSKKGAGGESKKEKKDLSKVPYTSLTGESLVGQKDLEFYVQKGYIKDISVVRPAKEGEVIPYPDDDEAVVFLKYFKAGLRFPCIPAIEEIFSLCKVQLHQLTPSAFVKISSFFWSARCEGAPLSGLAFLQSHYVHKQTQCTDLPEGERQLCYGVVNFVSRKGAKLPVTVSKNRWSSNWTKYWFYHKVPAGSSLRSVMSDINIIREVNRAPTPETNACLNAVGLEAGFFSVRDLVEEFVALKRWPLENDLEAFDTSKKDANGFSLPFFPLLGLRPLWTRLKLGVRTCWVRSLPLRFLHGSKQCWGPDAIVSLTR